MHGEECIEPRIPVPLTLMDNLEGIPVRVEDICGVVAG
jgi:hypothetical protein